MNPIKLKYLITGTGRCGTVFMARLLSSIDIGCTHEAFFQHDNLQKAKHRLEARKFSCSYVSLREGKDWLKGEPEAESSYMAAPYIPEILELYPEIKVIHVIRNPLEVAASFAEDVGTFKDNPESGLVKYQNFIYRQMPEIKDYENMTDRICYFIVKWNEMIESHCSKMGDNYLALKVEHAKRLDFYKFLGLPEKPKDYFKTPVNSWKKQGRMLFNPEEIVDNEVRKLFIDMIKKRKYFISL